FGIAGSLRCRHPAGIRGTPPSKYTTAGDGAAVRLRCGVVRLVVTPTGLRSTGGSPSQRLGSVYGWPTILSGGDVTLSVVTVGRAVDFRTGRPRVGLTDLISKAAYRYGVAVLSRAWGTHNSRGATATRARPFPPRALKRASRAPHPRPVP